MKLYHGTSEAIARKALSEGLKPRSLTGSEGNWKHTIDSDIGHVYLTETYAGYFAFSAANLDEEKPKWGIIEVDTDKLDPEKFYPDEDYLAQAYKGDDMPEDLKERTVFFRSLITAHKDKAMESLQRMGTISYRGTIPPEAITRVSIFDPETNYGIALAASDPTITIMNFIVCSDKHRAITKWFMGEKIRPSDFYGSMGEVTWKLMSKEDKEKAKRILAQQKVEIIKGKD